MQIAKRHISQYRKGAMYMELYLEQATQEVLRNFSKQHGQKIILMEKQILILTMIEIKVKQTYLDMWN